MTINNDVTTVGIRGVQVLRDIEPSINQIQDWAKNVGEVIDKLFTAPSFEGLTAQQGKVFDYLRANGFITKGIALDLGVGNIYEVIRQLRIKLEGKYSLYTGYDKFRRVLWTIQAEAV